MQSFIVFFGEQCYNGYMKNSTNKIFFTSDMHVSHKNILKFNPNTRPYSSIEEMNESLINNWNSVVGENDIVWNLGDVFFGPKEGVREFLSQLNGSHHLVLGNHDQRFAKMTKDGQLQLTELGENCLSMGLFRSIQSYAELRLGKDTICLSHYAMRVWNKSDHGSYHLYGHFHGSMLGEGRSMDVGIDSSDLVSDGKPFSWEDIKAHLSVRDYKTHH